MATSTLPKSAPVDTYFIVNKAGKFLDASFAFTLNAPYDKNVYSATTEAAAKAVITARSLTGASVLDIPRYVS